MAIKPTEVRVVAALLTQSWENPEDAARAIIQALDDRRFAHNKEWCIIRPSLGLIYGPYATQGAARKAAAKAVGIYTQPEEARLARLFRNIGEEKND